MHYKGFALALLTLGIGLAGCEREQEGTPLEPDPTAEQEQRIQAENGEPASGDAENKQTHTATGTIESIDFENEQITIDHDRVEALGWPPMTMPFALQDAQLLEGLEKGMKVEFQFHEGTGGQFVVETIQERPEG